MTDDAKRKKACTGKPETCGYPKLFCSYPTCVALDGEAPVAEKRRVDLGAGFDAQLDRVRDNLRVIEQAATQKLPVRVATQTLLLNVSELISMATLLDESRRQLKDTDSSDEP